MGTLRGVIVRHSGRRPKTMFRPSVWVSIPVRLILIAVAPRAAEASCKYIAPWEILELSSAIFEGTVLEDATAELPESLSRYHIRAVRCRVDHPWVGTFPEKVIVTSWEDHGDPLNSIGEDLLFCGWPEESGTGVDGSPIIRASECTRTRLVACAESELRALEFLVAGASQETTADGLAHWFLASLPRLTPNTWDERCGSRGGYYEVSRDLAAALPLIGTGRRAEVLDLLESECRDPDRADMVLNTFAHRVGDEWPGSVDWMTRMLRDPDPRIRAAAADDVLRTPAAREPGIRAALIEATQDADPEVASTALRLYTRENSRPGEEQGARSALIGLIESGSRLRGAAATVLLTWADSLTVDQRVRLLRSPDPLIWQEFAKVFYRSGQMSDVESQELLHWLAEPERRSTSLRMISFALDRSPYLLAHLENWLPTLAVDEQIALVRRQLHRGSPEFLSLIPRLQPAVLDAALEAPLPTTHPVFRWQIVTGMASDRPIARLRALNRSATDQSGGADHQQAVLACLRDSNGAVRAAALDHLAGLDPEWKRRAIPDLEALAVGNDSLAVAARRILTEVR